MGAGVRRRSSLVEDEFGVTWEIAHTWIHLSEGKTYLRHLLSLVATPIGGTESGCQGRWCESTSCPLARDLDPTGEPTTHRGRLCVKM